MLILALVAALAVMAFPVHASDTPKLTASDSVPANVRDLRDAHKLGLPFAGCWNTSFFPFSWHVDQVRSGRRLVPSIGLPSMYGDGNATIPKVSAGLDRFATEWEFLRDNRLPLVIRYNNVAQIFPSRPRLPLTEENRLKSPIIWRLMPDGSLNDTPFADPLGPQEIWSEEGAALGRSLYVQTLQKLHSDPAWVTFVENHEGSELKIKAYCDISRVKQKDGSFVESWKWKSPDALAAVSLRMRDWVAVNGGSGVWPSYLRYSSEYNTRYRSFYDAFRDTLQPAWQRDFMTAQYSAGDGLTLPPDVIAAGGPNPQAACVNGWGHSIYVGWHQTPGDLTDKRLVQRSTESIPGWEYQRERDAKCFREPFVWIGEGSAQAGKKAGSHEVITPDRWSAFCEWLLWQCRAQSGGVPVMLHHWIGAKTRPSDRFFAESTDPALSGYTEGDYVNATALACDRICEHPTIREHWLCGETTLLPVPTVPQRVWVSMTRLGDERLLYAWTPCLLIEPVEVATPEGPVTIDFSGRPSAYVIRHPARWLPLQ